MNLGQNPDWIGFQKNAARKETPVKRSNLYRFNCSKDSNTSFSIDHKMVLTRTVTQLIDYLIPLEILYSI